MFLRESISLISIPLEFQLLPPLSKVLNILGLILILQILMLCKYQEMGIIL